MKRFVSAFVLLLAFSVQLLWGVEEGWFIRYPNIYKDKIVFTYENDLWVVSSQGGMATRLTSAPGAEWRGEDHLDGVYGGGIVLRRSGKRELERCCARFRPSEFECAQLVPVDIPHRDRLCAGELPRRGVELGVDHVMRFRRDERRGEHLRGCGRGTANQQCGDGRNNLL